MVFPDFALKFIFMREMERGEREKKGERKRWINERGGGGKRERPLLCYGVYGVWCVVAMECVRSKNNLGSIPCHSFCLRVNSFCCYLLLHDPVWLVHKLLGILLSLSCCRNSRVTDMSSCPPFT